MAMPSTLSVPLAWRQLRHEPARLAAAVAGIAFAVVLVFLQLGFDAALFESNVRVHTHLRADLVLVSPRTTHLGAARSFPRRRLHQALGADGVAGGSVLRAGLVPLKDRASGLARDVLVLGVDPSASGLEVPEVDAALPRLRLADTFLFDRTARPEFAPVVRELEGGGPASHELGGRRVTLAGLFTLGTSFGIDAVLVTSDANFERVLPGRHRGQAEIGLVRLASGADVGAVQRALRADLPRDVDVLTTAELAERERIYWRETTPIGYIISLSVAMAWVVGAVFVYQILFTNVAGQLPAYATLKAIGFGDLWMLLVIVEQATLLAVLGFVPGIAVAARLYRTAGDATRLPMELSLPTSIVVLMLTVAMCATAGACAARRVRFADPAELVS
jgi:putative ABC transport system permease protein